MDEENRPAKAGQTDDKKRRWRLVLTSVIMVAALTGIYFLMQSLGLIEFFSSRERIRTWIEGYGIWAPLAFMLLQVAQVVIAPIPGNVTTLVGGVLFGFWVSVTISLVAIFVGSMICFWLAKTYGRPLVIKMVDEKTVDKYLHELSSRQRIALVLIFLFPFFPDDTICLIAGLTPIKTHEFMWMVILTRPWGTIGSSLLGASVISIPLWGWIVIGVATVGIFIVAMKFGPQIEDFFKQKYRKLKEGRH
ncbi:MAG: TVP38/TMEM64 family protein [Eubacteriales bacterium]